MTNQPALREVDPARDLQYSPASPQAQALLREILATPGAPAARSRTRVALAGVGAAAAVVATILATGTLGSPAYAVHRNGDGSVDVTLDFDQFDSPAALQHSLDEAGVPAVVLSGPASAESVHLDKSGQIVSQPRRSDCADYRALATDPGASPYDADQPVSYGSSARFDGTQLHLRPGLLPEDGTFVVKIYRSGGEVSSLSGDVALGAPPTCLT